MTHEDTELLLKDLCARIPYWIDLRIQYDSKDYTPFGYGAGRISMLASPIMSCTVGYAPTLEEIKPYLRPMSSMTDKEVKELVSLGKTAFCTLEPGRFREIANPKQIDWLNAHHFDYRGLIEKGLALEAPDNMYKEG